MKPESLISFTSKGIYCPQADVYIDPWKPVNRAIITHAHADHARTGNGFYLSHHDSRNILKHRLGEIHIETMDYSDPVQMNGVKVSLHPAGHVIGSAQVRLESNGRICVITGDFKTEDDQISIPYEPVKTQTLVMESTFGLPVYRWKDQQLVFEEIFQWWRENQEQGFVSVLCGYALGKAQRLIYHLFKKNIGEIFVHGAIFNMNQVIGNYGGFDFSTLPRAEAGTQKKAFEGALIITPSSALGTPWMRKFHPYRTAIASGWMAIRGARRRRSVDRGFVLSDHADWNGLNQAVKESEATEIYVTHGYSHEFSHWLNEKGIRSSPVQTSFEGELGEINEQGIAD
jgi:putative mRNA 3-end processing factor